MLWADTTKESFLPSLVARLEARIAETGESEAQFGKRMGASEAMLKNLRNGSFPAVDRLHILLNEIGETLTVGAPQPEIPGYGDYVEVPVMAADLAAGDGAINGDDQITDFVSFRRDWFRRIGVSPKHCVLAHVRGDSMLPTLRNRDVVLIDTAQRIVPPRPKGYKSIKPPIYAFLVEGEARIKRLSYLETDIVALTSDNPEFHVEFRGTTDPDLLRIIGRVIWWGHTVRD